MGVFEGLKQIFRGSKDEPKMKEKMPEKMPKNYEELMEMMSEMPVEEMEKKMEEMTKICQTQCGKCPSYEGTGETKFLFCGNGESDKISEEKGCTCGGCQVQKDMMLRWDYYCMKGSGKDQAGIP